MHAYKQLFGVHVYVHNAQCPRRVKETASFRCTVKFELLHKIVSNLNFFCCYSEDKIIYYLSCMRQTGVQPSPILNITKVFTYLHKMVSTRPSPTFNLYRLAYYLYTLLLHCFISKHNVAITTVIVSYIKLTKNNHKQV